MLVFLSVLLSMLSLIDSCSLPPDGLWSLALHEAYASSFDQELDGYGSIQRVQEHENFSVGRFRIWKPHLAGHEHSLYVQWILDVEMCELHGLYTIADLWVHDTMVWRFDDESSLIRLDDTSHFPVAIDPVQYMHKLIYEGPLNPLEDPNLVSL